MKWIITGVVVPIICTLLIVFWPKETKEKPIEWQQQQQCNSIRQTINGIDVEVSIDENGVQWVTVLMEDL